MKRLESLGTYAHLGRFDSPDDRLEFIESNSKLIVKDAVRGFALHGRGIVLLQPKGGPFVTSWYCQPEPEDFTTLRDAAQIDFDDYEPTEEMLVGIEDQGGDFLGFWRIRFDYST